MLVSQHTRCIWIIGGNDKCLIAIPDAAVYAFYCPLSAHVGKDLALRIYQAAKSLRFDAQERTLTRPKPGDYTSNNYALTDGSSVLRKCNTSCWGSRRNRRRWRRCRRRWNRRCCEWGRGGVGGNSLATGVGDCAGSAARTTGPGRDNAGWCRPTSSPMAVAIKIARKNRVRFIVRLGQSQGSSWKGRFGWLRWCFSR